MFIARYVKKLTLQRLDSSLSSSGEKRWEWCCVFAPLVELAIATVEMWHPLAGISPYY
jgi:hypothetical protein